MGAVALVTLPALWTGAWSFGMAQIEYPASLAITGPSATVRLSSNEPLTVAFGGDRLATNYHAFTPDHRPPATWQRQREARRTVIEGQRLGRCGNSGNTSEPHIHRHHQREDPEVFPVGFAEGPPLFFRNHDGLPMPEGGVEARDGRHVVRGAVVRHLGTPVGGTVSRLGPEQ